MNETTNETDLLAAAAVIGTEHGTNAAQWHEIDQDAAGRILEGMDDCDPEIMDALPSADLSGQMADGYTTAQLVADVDAPEDNDEDLIPLSERLADAYCDAFNVAVENEIGRTCRALLSTD